MNQTLPLTDSLYAYLLQTGLREHPALAALRAETASNRMAKMQIAPEQGQLIGFLAHTAPPPAVPLQLASESQSPAPR